MTSRTWLTRAVRWFSLLTRCLSSTPLGSALRYRSRNRHNKHNGSVDSKRSRRRWRDPFAGAVADDNLDQGTVGLVGLAVVGTLRVMRVRGQSGLKPRFSLHRFVMSKVRHER